MKPVLGMVVSNKMLKISGGGCGSPFLSQTLQLVCQFRYLKHPFDRLQWEPTRMFCKLNIITELDLTSGGRKNLTDDLFHKSWSFTTEASDTEFIKNYFTGDQYLSDSTTVSEDSLAFAKTIEIVGDGKDVWIFDIDETLLSNLPYNATHGFSMDNIDETSANEWVESAACPALPASLKLYNELRGLGFSIVLLTGRYEHQRNCTVKNLISAGFHDWEKLILQGPSDEGKPGAVYKSEKRKELETEGYRIHGNSGDQWSDLLGSPAATRSFKLPNPLYHIP